MLLQTQLWQISYDLDRFPIIKTGKSTSNYPIAKLMGTRGFARNECFGCAKKKTQGVQK